jgi:hypothetical protein
MVVNSIGGGAPWFGERVRCGAEPYLKRSAVQDRIVVSAHNAGHFVILRRAEHYAEAPDRSLPLTPSKPAAIIDKEKARDRD